VLFGGSWDADFDGPDGLLDKFYAELSVSEKETGDKRSAGHNPRGHQLTPAFVEAVLRDVMADPEALAGERAVSKPRGGFTDVGLHTGGNRRNTAWPLVRISKQSYFFNLGKTLRCVTRIHIHVRL